MLMPIPRWMLIHSATQHYGTPAKDTWGNKTWPSSRALTRVRIEPTTKLIRTKDNREIKLSAIMFFDCRNSGPDGVAFALGDQIQRPGGATYTVAGGIEPLYDATRAHHWEVELE
jgi:hypothetical protein